MAGTLHLYVCDDTMVDKAGDRLAVRHVNAGAQYDNEAECRAAINDVLERYAVGKECLFRQRGEPVSQVDFATGLTFWSASVRFTALPRSGPWHDPPSGDAPIIYGLL